MDLILLCAWLGIIICASWLAAAFLEHAAERKRHAAQVAAAVITEAHHESQPVRIVPVAKPATLERQQQGFDVQDLFGGSA